jgi:GWxTD domain-containing protein
MVAKSFFGVLFLLLLLSGNSIPQPAVPVERASMSTWTLRSDKDSVTICTAYSIPFDRIIFAKSGNQNSAFTAALSFTIDAVDSISGHGYHLYSVKTVSARNFEESRTKSKSAFDFVTATLPRSVYHTTAEVRDEDQKISYLTSVTRFNLLICDSTYATSIVFLDSTSGASFFPTIRNNVARFPAPIRFLVMGNPADLRQPTFSLSSGSMTRIVDHAPLVLHTQRLEPETGPTGLRFSGADDSVHSFYFGEVPTDSLPEGTYNLTIRRGPDSVSSSFQYLWLDKPSTLRNLSSAVFLLKYIAPDSVTSEINSGNEQEIRDKFDAYWKSRDPTPSTAFNELEAEYYRRADYAYEEFRSVGTRNGAATDRGKAYILFGQPEKIQREYRSGGTYEVWTYQNLGRILVFKEHNFGDFKLYQTEKI